MQLFQQGRKPSRPATVAAVDRNDDLRLVDGALTRIGRIANSRRASAHRSRRSGVDLPPTAVATLSAIYRLGPTRLRTIAEHLELEPSRVSREVRRLVEDGLVAQREDPDDRRATSLVATRSGRAAFERYRAAADAILADAVADWSDADIRRLAKVLDRLADSLG
jgi:DNA-binding MarR family transcriptional regulator